jgi:hypothetical protein
MRKLAVALTVVAVTILAGSFVWKAEATTPGGDPGIPTTARDFSPVVKTACGPQRPDDRCGPGKHWYVPRIDTAGATPANATK